MAQDCAVADKCSGGRPGCGWSPSAAGPSAVVASSSEDPVAKYLCCSPTPHPVPHGITVITNHRSPVFFASFGDSARFDLRTDSKRFLFFKVRKNRTRTASFIAQRVRLD